MLVFMGHNITTVGGSVLEWLLEDVEDCNMLAVSCMRDFVYLFLLPFFPSNSLSFTVLLRLLGYCVYPFREDSVSRH